MAGWELPEVAWKVVFIVLLFGTLGLSAIYAVQLSKEVVPEPPVRGRKTGKENIPGLEKSIKRLRRLENTFTLRIIGNAFLIGLLGVVFPIALFCILCLNATWLMEASPFILSDGSRSFTASTT